MEEILADSVTDGINDFNNRIIADLRANDGRVSGPWAGTPIMLIHHIGPSPGSSARLGPARLREWRAEILGAGCPATQGNHALSVLSAALGAAAADGRLRPSPAPAFASCRSPSPAGERSRRSRSSG